MFSKKPVPYLKWQGSLSEQQEKASKEIVLSIKEYTDRVVWAVTGAGKTEMLFKGISEALEAGKRVCVASPRIDVCLELAPRIQAAFPDIQTALLYGGEESVYIYTQLVIATTHQLLRFKEAFDVLIIDEIDAFPYYQNEGLYYASEKAIKKQSSTIYLTATPDRKLQRKIAKGQIEASILPARYHGYPLPVPKIIRGKDIFSMSDISASKVCRQILMLISRGQKFLLFIPTIRLMDSILPALRRFFSTTRFESVHAQDPFRKEKVESMRKGELQFLITTTILERGVTFKNIDVIVLAADHDVYTESALVQIAGRAGRSADYPEGKVTFYLEEWTRSSKGAVQQIRQMNRQAEKKGLLL
ncbi:DEAD/DEAH box helicase [Alkalibacterium sp. m-11]